MTDDAWLELFHGIATEVRNVVTPLIGTAAGRVEIGRGAGGDRTVELDRAAEEVVLGRLRALAARGERFSVVSEEAGSIDLGAPYPVVFVDPVDGSLNAKRGVPVSAVMLSLLDGPLLDDVRIGLVHNLVSGQRWHAVRDGGLTGDGVRLTPPPGEGARLEVVGLESSPRNLEAVKPVIARAGKLRLLGAMAISLVQVASGGFDLFCSARPARAFDMAAGLLMIREVGGVATDLAGRRVGAMEASLRTRTTLLCAADPEVHRTALDLLAGS
jgi:myo-inositol-1(or 4)-monophosphatase